MASVWQWLGENNRELGALSSLVFGISSGALASTALWVGYRNNFGWKPFVLVEKYGIGGGGRDGARMSTTFAVWNRQKYPVVIWQIVVRFPNANIVKPLNQSEGIEEGKWRVNPDKHLVLDKRIKVEPHTSTEFDPAAQIDDRSALTEPAIEVRYFDPRIGRVRVAVNQRRRFWRLP